MDVQTGLVGIYCNEPAEFTARAAGVLDRARQLGMRILHIKVGFRPGLPEVSGRNPLFAAIKNSPQHQQLFQSPAGDIHPAVAPQTDDVVIVKHRVSALRGTDLEMILRANGIETLVLFGIATSGVVLSTLLEATDLDYSVVVIQDCCADLDRDLHSALIDNLFPRRGKVATAAEFIMVSAAAS
jgi:nicotinamidase-related amidase